MITLGDRLKNARLAQGLSLQDVSDRLKIRTEYLQSVEEGAYSALPSRTYAQGFVKNYISLLGLPERESMAIFRREFTEKEFGSILPIHATRERGLSAGWRLGPMAIVGSVFVFGLIAFFVFQFRAFLFDPYLSVSKPAEGQLLHTGITQIQGSTVPGAIVSIDGEPALVEKSGNFSKEISLFTGEQTIIIVARNENGRSSTVLRRVKVD